eukprot:TRINITY_DN17974_c0_g1_i1.p1 TRINITY_DN17974_c0_g1~~TRINITY_DN17974_c0_g1_i1.p1  ORF type:complete len:183 (+),score=18.77 TRINITY_DN17974_c0_g1_i1:212-760(+)
MSKLLLGTTPAPAGQLTGRLDLLSLSAPPASKPITRVVTVDMDADHLSKQKEKMLAKRRDRRTKQREHKLAREEMERMDRIGSLKAQSEALVAGLGHNPAPAEAYMPMLLHSLIPTCAGVSSSKTLGGPMYVVPSQIYGEATSHGAVGGDDGRRNGAWKHCRCCGKLVSKRQASLRHDEDWQ